MTKRRVQTAGLAGAIVLVGLALLRYPQAVSGGIRRGLSVCGEVLIPSLFPFLVLGSFLTRSGVAEALGRRLEKVTTVLFGLPGCCAVGIVIGAVGGYPAGGAITAELVRRRQITAEEGRRMLRFCVNAGPGFLVSTVGAGLMGNTVFGVLLMAAHLAASLLLGVIGVPHGSRRRRESQCRSVPRTLPTTALVEAVRASCETLLNMCGFVLLFAGVLALVDVSGLVTVMGGGTPKGEKIVSALIACLLEVSCGCTAAASLGELAPFVLGLAVGFGGLSVHCQLATELRGLGVMGKGFFAARVAHGALTALFTQLLLKWVPLSQPVNGSLVTPVVQTFSDSALCSAALLVTVGMWMLVFPLRLDKEE